MIKKYYNKAYLNEINSKCYNFGCRLLKMDDLSDLMGDLNYLYDNQCKVWISCIDSTYNFMGGTKKQYIAAIILQYAINYGPTAKDVADFLQKIK